MHRIWWFAGALALVACNKGGDSGKANSGPASCADFMSALADCYSEADRELSEGGIDPETWCADFEAAGGDDAIFDCYLDQIDAGTCSTSEEVARTSESLQDCEDTE